MANFTNNTVTVEGRKLIANSLLNGTGIEFTHFAIGDGAPPAAPEDLTSVVSELFTVNVSKVHASDTESGVTVVRGSFRNNTGRGGFYFREIGLYARTQGTEDEPILFGYTSADPADFIPAVGIGSPVEQGIVLSIVTGNATVLYIESSIEAATWADLRENNATIKAEIDKFTDEKMAEITAAVDELDTKLQAAAEELSKAEEGFVMKAGDTMTGDLNMGTNKVIGTATRWGDWFIYSSLDELNAAMSKELTEASTMLEIGQAMPDKSRLIHATSDGSATESAACYPNKNGVLEIVKYSSTRCVYTFTSANGSRWQAASDGDTWGGWITADGIPAGVMHEYAGNNTAPAPYGYLWCFGQSVAVADYPSLFAAIGYLYGGEGDNFNVPDMRGMFPRGKDNGRGLDPNREIGSYQECGAPNITGWFNARQLHDNAVKGDGALYSPPDWGYNGTQTPGSSFDQWQTGIAFDASRCSSVYQNGLNEVRPRNIALNYIIKY